MHRYSNLTLPPSLISPTAFEPASSVRPHTRAHTTTHKYLLFFWAVSKRFTYCNNRRPYSIATEPSKSDIGVGCVTSIFINSAN